MCLSRRPQMQTSRARSRMSRTCGPDLPGPRCLILPHASHPISSHLISSHLISSAVTAGLVTRMVAEIRRLAAEKPRSASDSDTAACARGALGAVAGSAICGMAVSAGPCPVPRTRPAGSAGGSADVPRRSRGRFRAVPRTAPVGSTDRPGRPAMPCPCMWPRFRMRMRSSPALWYTQISRRA